MPPSFTTTADGDALFAVAAPGLETIVAGELAALGFSVGETEPGGVSFRGGDAELIRANLWLRSASRVLVRVGAFHASSFHELERRARALPWAAHLPTTRGVRFRVSCHRSRLYHTAAIAERLLGSLPSSPRRPAPPSSSPRPDEDDIDDDCQLFVVRLIDDQCVVSADSSGALLHRRGYRLATAKAPLRETLAAALLLASRWDVRAPLLDPMCGSGTIAIEAALLARRIAPGLGRRFHCLDWPGFDSRAFDAALEQARATLLPSSPAPILASDRDPGAVRAALANAERAGVADDLQIAERPLSAVVPPTGPGWLVTNPPYGVRTGERRRLRDLHAALGQLARHQLPGWTLAVLTADAALAGESRLPIQSMLQTRNGGIAVRLFVGKMPG